MKVVPENQTAVGAPRLHELRERPGFLLNAFIVIVCLGIFWYRWPIDWSNGFNAKLPAVIVIAVLHAG